MTIPSAEGTAKLVRGLLVDQHPDLAGLAIREVPGGWTTRCGASVATASPLPILTGESAYDRTTGAILWTNP